MKTVEIYDTTLRDGTQGEGISFSGADKILIAEKLDDFGIRYIEGGWPGSNPKDIHFFKAIRKVPLKQAKIAAFGSTRRANSNVEKDHNIITLLEAETPAITIFGKSWDLHVEKVLKTTFDENLVMIGDSISYLKKHDRIVIYDAEHFFDGYKANPKYALKTLKVAVDSGADIVCLCDTNGGTLTSETIEIIEKVRKHISGPVGIHVHNDSGLAVANSVISVEHGITHIQGTINGYGERCGNANLCTIIPLLSLKMGINVISDDKLKELTNVSRFVDELANQKHDKRLPYTGASAFAHKGGMHVNAVEKVSRSFEHIKPELVGNQRRILVSELAGKSNILFLARELGIDLSSKSEETRKIVEEIKKLEHEGYEFEAAEASLKLLINKVLEKHKEFFELEGFRIIVEKRGNRKPLSEATIKVKVNEIPEYTAAEGDGPVNALDKALRKALQQFYPSIGKVHLADFKVRVVDAKAGTAAKVRVFIESKDDEDIWCTVGVSENIIEASWQALVDSVEYKLLKDEEKKGKTKDKA